MSRMSTKSKTVGRYIIIYSGQQDTHHRGVALIMNKQSAITLMEVEPINERLIMGDMNTKVGSDNIDREWEMGCQCCRTINNNSERLVNLCLNNKCTIGGTIFQHKDIHKVTWMSPDGKTVNQIDHAVINNKWRRSFKDVYTCRGADAGSDHQLVISRLNLCVMKNRPMKYNIPRLKQDAVLKTLVVEIKNEFQLLSTEETDHPQVEGEWNQIKDVYCNTAKTLLDI